MAIKDILDVLAAATEAMATEGVNSQAQMDEWNRLMRTALLKTIGARKQSEAFIRDTLGSVYKRYVTNAKVLSVHPGVQRFTLARLSPRLQMELHRRIMTSANLIKLNREQAIDTTLRRFSGWLSSIPVDGSRVIDKAELRKDITAPVKALTFQERRVSIDQGHKLVASINDIIAQDNGALAMTWHSHWRQAGYNYRKDHKERDGKVYLLRDSWAKKAGLIKPGAAGYADEITAPGEEVFCRCSAVYIYNLRSLPKDMLTKKGELYLSRPAQMRA